MGASERLCLRWNDFESNIKHGFSELREEEEFFDVTLACDNKQIKAHKVILSACSPFFRQIIKSIPHQHPLLYLRGIKFTYLESLLSFMYNGEVNVTQEDLNNFLAVAEELKVKGLTQNNADDGCVGEDSVGTAGGSAVGGSGGDVKPKTEQLDGGPPIKRARPSKSNQSPAPSTSSSTSGGGSGHRRPHPQPRPSPRQPHPTQQQQQHQQQQHHQVVDDDEIEDVTPVKSEPKDTTAAAAATESSMVVTPDLGGGADELGEDAYAEGEENYDDYGQYGSESGDMTYGDGGQMMDPSMAVAGPSGAADGNKGGNEAIKVLDSAITRLTLRLPNGNYACKKCGREFAHRTSLRNHVEAKHVMTDGFQCHFCAKVFKTRNSLSVHISKQHTNVTPYIPGTRPIPQQQQQQQQQSSHDQQQKQQQQEQEQHRYY